MKHPRASSWFRESAIAARKLSPQVLSWLCDQESLTKRLIDRCGNRFSVRVLSQQWVRPGVDEARMLKIPPQQIVLLRQVQLLDGKHVLVYARSLIPLHTLAGPHRRLKYLGDKALGAYLFAHPGLKREQLQLATITPNNPLFATALSDSRQDCPCIWGRRSLFRLDDKSLLVSEYFLPALIDA